jgi:hypothetical protein
VGRRGVGPLSCLGPRRRLRLGELVRGSGRSRPGPRGPRPIATASSVVALRDAACGPGGGTTGVEPGGSAPGPVPLGPRSHGWEATRPRLVSLSRLVRPPDGGAPAHEGTPGRQRRAGEAARGKGPAARMGAHGAPRTPTGSGSFPGRQVLRDLSLLAGARGCRRSRGGEARAAGRARAGGGPACPQGAAPSGGRPAGISGSPEVSLPGRLPPVFHVEHSGQPGGSTGDGKPQGREAPGLRVTDVSSVGD